MSRIRQHAKRRIWGMRNRLSEEEFAAALDVVEKEAIDAFLADGRLVDAVAYMSASATGSLDAMQYGEMARALRHRLVGRGYERRLELEAAARAEDPEAAGKRDQK